MNQIQLEKVTQILGAYEILKMEKTHLIRGAITASYVALFGPELSEWRVWESGAIDVWTKNEGRVRTYTVGEDMRTGVVVTPVDQQGSRGFEQEN